MESKQTLGKRIATLRKAQGLTQEQLAEKVGVSAQAVSNWENDMTCPDITTIPLLADIFGVTTDELLGVKPVEPHIVILDKEENKKEDKAPWHWEAHIEGKWSGIACCITVILICTFLILRYTNPTWFRLDDFGNWSYIWPILIFGLGLSVVTKHWIAGPVLMAFGVYEFLYFLLPASIGLPTIEWYIILLAIAILVMFSIIFGKVFKKWQWKRYQGGHYSNKAPTVEYSDDNDYIKTSMSFGGNSIVYPNEMLRGAEIETNFGDYTFDLTGVKTFKENCLMHVDVNFGNVVILLPRTVRMTKKSDTAFASFSIKGEPLPDATQSVIVDGDVNFGNLEVRYQY